MKLEKKVEGSEKVASLPQIVPIVSQSRVGNVNKLFNKFPFKYDPPFSVTSSKSKPANALATI